MCRNSRPDVLVFSLRGGDKVDKPWTIKDLALFLGISVSAINKWVMDDRIPYTKCGSKVRFIPGDIENWLRAGGHRNDPMLKQKASQGNKVVGR